MGSKSPTQTTTVNTPPPQVLAQYQAATTKANAAAAQPYTPYGGQLVAPVNAEQGTGVGGVNNYANAAQPYLTGAAGLTLAGAGPANAQQFSAGALNQYLSPYTQDVVNATQAAFQNQNTQQAQSLEGQTIGAGAFGGDRAGVAQGILAGQQQTAEAPVIAGLYNQGYTQALGEFNTQQQTNLSAQQANLARLQGAGLQLGNIGTASQTAGLQGAGAQLQAGTLQQQTQQAADTAAYNQFLQQQAYPFQTAQFQANIAEGIGSNSGGTSTASTSAPNSAAPYIGAGLGLLALAGARGGRIWPRYANGGLVIDARHRFAGGGGLVIPYASNEGNVDSWVPQSPLPMGRGMGIPNAMNPANSNNQAQNIQAMQSIGQGIGKLGNSGIGDAISDFAQDFAFANGGLVLRRGYDDGGMTDPSPSDLAMLRAAMLAAPPQQSTGAIDPSIAARAIAAQQGKFQNRVPPETQYPLPPSQTSPPVSSVIAPGTLATYRDSILNPPASAPVAATNPAPFPVAAPPGLTYSNNGAGAFPASAYVPRGTPASFAQPSADLPTSAEALSPPAPSPDASSPPQNSSGLFGLHLSDPVRAGLLSAAFGVMASPSRNLAMAIGQGGQQGVATYEQALNQAREQMLTKAQIANYQSEIATRPQDIALRAKALDLQVAQIQRQLAAGSAMAGGSSAAPSVGGPAPALGSVGAGAPAIPGPSAAGSSPQGSAGSAPTPLANPNDTFWQGVPDLENPITLNARAKAVAPYNPELAGQLMTKAQAIVTRGTVLRNGQYATIPQYLESQAAVEGAKTAAQKAAENAALPSIDPATGAKFIPPSGTPAPSTPPAAPATPSKPFSIDPETAKITTNIPPAPNGGGYIVPNLPAGSKLTDLPPVTQEQIKADNEFLKEEVATSRATDSVISRTQAIAQAFKTFQSGSLTDHQHDAAALAVALGQPGIGQAIMNGSVSGPEWVDKEGVNSVLDTLKAATPRFAQAEFRAVADKGTPSTTKQPQTNNQMVAEMLAVGNRNKAFLNDWEQAKQQGWSSPTAFYTAWQTANPLDGFIKSSQRQIGNFAGMDLPPASDWTAGTVYVAPTKMDTPKEQYFAKRGIEPGGLFRFNGHGTAQEVQPIGKSEYFSAQLGAQ